MSLLLWWCHLYVLLYLFHYILSVLFGRLWNGPTLGFEPRIFFHSREERCVTVTPQWVNPPQTSSALQKYREMSAGVVRRQDICLARILQWMAKINIFNSFTQCKTLFCTVRDLQQLLLQCSFLTSRGSSEIGDQVFERLSWGDVALILFQTHTVVRTWHLPLIPGT